MIKDLEIDGKHYRYEIVRKRIKNIIARVDSNSIIRVSASRWVAEYEIINFLTRHVDWMDKSINQKEKRKKFQFENLKWVDGEVVQLLGKERRLSIVDSDIEKVDLDESFLYIYTQNHSNIKKQLENWMDQECAERFGQIMEKTSLVFTMGDRQIPRLKIKKLKTFWGSYSKKTNTITLNKLLITTDPKCIEYVMMHEWIHTIHYDHKAGFHKMFQELMPDYKARRKELEAQSIL